MALVLLVILFVAATVYLILGVTNYSTNQISPIFPFFSPLLLSAPGRVDFDGEGEFRV